MALVLINGPDNAPSTSTDWDKVNDVLQTIGLDINKPTRIIDGYVLRGSVIFFAGAWYVADSDTAVTGSQSDYIKLVNTAGVVAAEYVEALVDVTFNRTWNGWYDPDGNMYLFDEIKAYAAGAVTSPVTIKNYRPSLNWSKAISRVLSAANLARLFRLDTEVVLTGSGNWTVPAGVYWIEGEIIAPGEDGGDGSTNQAGAGGSSGEWRHFEYAVTPGQVIQYAITKSSTIFGTTTLLAGGWFPPISRNGGGIKPGAGGLDYQDGGDATDGYGGGGGGAGAMGPTGVPRTYGGAGGLGSVRIR